MKKKKYAKVPKKYQVTKEHPAVWRQLIIRNKGLLFGRLWYPLWILRPICWLVGHKNKISWIYGAKVKHCERCGFIEKPTKEKRKIMSALYRGIVGELWGVKVIETTRRKNDQNQKST